MGGIETTVDPSDVGLDAARLERIASHFDGYVQSGRLAGYLATVSRKGEVAYVGMGGWRDKEADLAMSADTIFRIYSMTKPITTVAAMRLWEEGRFELTDELAKYIPSFSDPQVFSGGTETAPETVPSREPIRLWHLMTHTSGMTYGFQYCHPVDALYRQAGYEWGSPKDKDLAQVCEDWASLPIIFEPGSAWNYSVATDVLGRVIEVITGETLDVALRRLVLDPLGMSETGFFAEASTHERVMQLYVPDGSSPRQAVAVPSLGTHSFSQPAVFSGGGGLVSTAADYRRFTSMLLHKGELDGVRVLGPRTLAMMTRNYLPGNEDIETMAQDSFSETASAGLGFGLGFSVVMDPTKSKTATSPGSFAWGGAASTIFWVDPVEELEVALYTQLLPSSTYPLRPQLSQLVYSSITS